MFKIGTQSAKDIRKDCPVFYVLGSAPAPALPTPPMFSVVLLHTKLVVCRFMRLTVGLYLYFLAEL